MLLELKRGTTLQEEMVLVGRLRKMGFQVEQSTTGKLAIVKGITREVNCEEFNSLPSVQKVHTLKTRFILASRQYKNENTAISIKGVEIGGGSLFVAGGPCSIESEEQIQACAKAAKAAGAHCLRGGAFKPRTSPYEFQGLQEEGLKLIQKAGCEQGLLTVSEVMEISQISLCAHYIDILQVGARNMQNFNLLKELGKLKTPVLLKKGPFGHISRSAYGCRIYSK